MMWSQVVVQRLRKTMGCLPAPCVADMPALIVNAAAAAAAMHSDQATAAWAVNAGSQLMQQRACVTVLRSRCSVLQCVGKW
jgi:hypothetical protein